MIKGGYHTLIIKSASKLRNIIEKIIITAGADERNADRLSEALVSSHLSGVDTHGIWHLKRYVDLIKAGEIIPNAWPEIIKETSNTALVKGNFTFGHVTAKFAMEVGIKKAKENNISIISGVQVSHTGRLGEYVEMAAAENMISMMYTGGFSEEEPAAVPYGGAKKILHTNPFAIGLPAGKEVPIIIDIATTTIAGTKIHIAKLNNQLLPEGCIVDKKGRPIRDPNEFFDDGGLLPFGGHKGYALMIANEYLGRIFTGSDLFVEKNRLGPVDRHSGFTMIVFKVDMFCSMKDLKERVDEIERRIRAVPTAQGFKEIQVPGDIESNTRAYRLKNGIPISDNDWNSILDLTKSLGIENIY